MYHHVKLESIEFGERSVEIEGHKRAQPILFQNRTWSQFRRSRGARRAGIYKGYSATRGSRETGLPPASVESLT